MSDLDSERVATFIWNQRSNPLTRDKQSKERGGVMKFGNAISLYFTLLLVGFSYRYCPVWDKALNKLLDKGTLLEVKSGIALFEHEAKLYEVFVGDGFSRFSHFGHLIGFNDEAIDRNFMRRPSFRTMDKLQRMITAEIERIAKEKERDMRVIMRSLLTEQNEGHNSSL